MKTFLFNLGARFESYINRLDDVTIIQNKHWVLIDDILSPKIVYIFCPNNELKISTDGLVKRAKWEFSVNKSLIIEIDSNNGFLFKYGYLDNRFLVLKLDNSKEYAVFVNEEKFEGSNYSIEQFYSFIDINYSNAFPNIARKPDSFKSKKIDNFDKYVEYATDKGKIYIKQDKNNSGLVLNSKVLQNGSIAPNGNYELEENKVITIFNGLIIEIISN